VPTKISLTVKVKLVVAGWYHNLIVDEDNCVWVAGSNARNQLGLGNSNSTLGTLHSPTRNQYLQDIQSVAAGQFHSLALDIHGVVYGFGYNSAGELGENKEFVSTPTIIANQHRATGVAAGILTSFLYNSPINRKRIASAQSTSVSNN
jgi:alpha-tubulin suppressor-like RCC1 family protein